MVKKKAGEPSDTSPYFFEDVTILDKHVVKPRKVEFHDAVTGDFVSQGISIIAGATNSSDVEVGSSKRDLRPYAPGERQSYDNRRAKFLYVKGGTKGDTVQIEAW